MEATQCAERRSYALFISSSGSFNNAHDISEPTHNWYKKQTASAPVKSSSKNDTSVVIYQTTHKEAFVAHTSWIISSFTMVGNEANTVLTLSPTPRCMVDYKTFCISNDFNVDVLLVAGGAAFCKVKPPPDFEALPKLKFILNWQNVSSNKKTQ